MLLGELYGDTASMATNPIMKIKYYSLAIPELTKANKFFAHPDNNYYLGVCYYVTGNEDSMVPPIVRTGKCQS
jgi:hypothetical protein